MARCRGGRPAFAPTGPAPPLRLLAGGGGGGGVVARAGCAKRSTAELTAELAALSAEELREGSARYKALLEARELESAVFGGC